MLAAPATWASAPTAGAGVGVDPGRRPSIVLILTDDQRWDELAPLDGPHGPVLPMPVVTRELAGHGVTFANAFVVNSYCCPSRTSILTGRYSHGTGIYTIRLPYGGFPAFRHEEGSTIAARLQRAGYTTGLFGKYLNQYGRAGHHGYVPPGWDRWVAFAENNGMYYDYDLSVDGAVVPNGDAPGDYSTRVVGREAARFIRGTDGPLFVYFAPAAPHGPATPAPGQWGMYRWLDRWRPPGYDEADVSDKPGWVRAHPPLDAAHRRRLDRARRRRLATLHPVDIAVRGIVRALRDTGRLHNTMIVFMSDNGFLLGEHRLHGKQAPYDESIRVPMVVRYDPLIDAARTDDRLVANIDLAPTWAQIAGVSQPGADGRSFVPLLSAENRPWRTAFLVEHLRDRTARMPTYCSVRSVRYDFTVYATGEEELYDLATDPYQLENRAGDPLMDLVRRDMLDRMRRLCRPYPPDGRFELPPF